MLSDSPQSKLAMFEFLPVVIKTLFADACHDAWLQTSKSFSLSAKFATSPLKIPPICRHRSFRLTLDALMTHEMNGWELPNKSNDETGSCRPGGRSVCGGDTPRQGQFG
jgi:hypothetical protein